MHALCPECQTMHKDFEPCADTRCEQCGDLYPVGEQSSGCRDPECPLAVDGLTIESAAAGITDIARDLDAIWEDKTTVERAADEIPTINRLTGLPMMHRTTRPPRRS